MCEEEKQLIIFQDRFSNLLEENIEAIKDERKLRGLISDYFPKEKWLNHLLISLYKDGIVEEIEKCESVEFESFLRFKKDLTSNYRTQEQEAEWAVNIWFESYGNYILKKDNNVRKYVHRNTAINSKEANELVEKIIQISQNMHYTENALQDILTIFQNASQYPNVLGKLYMLYPVLKQYYDTEETEYSYIMYYAIYNEKSICEYEDYMNLYNTLLSMKCNVDYYIYGIFLLKGAHSKDGVVSVKLNEEKGYKWCAYFFEKLKKMNNITKTRGLYFHIENLEFALGVAYLQGKYVKKDIKKATMCWKSMLKRNVNEYSDIEDAKKVLRCVGGAYIGKSVTVSVDGIKEYEIKVQKNLKLGYKFLEKASEYGDAFSLFCLAEMYEKGEYVKKDFFHAVQLYEQAEENGDDEAAEWIKENKTVVELIDDFKIRKNRKEGLKYLYKASELGNVKAILLLAEMYEQGNYVNKDVSKAYQLYKKAEAKGDESAREKIADLRSMLELEEISCSSKEKLIDIEEHKDEFIQLDENEYELVDVDETEDEWYGDELVEIDETEDFDED